MEMAEREAQDMIIQAEKHRAATEVPTGTFNLPFKNIAGEGSCVSSQNKNVNAPLVRENPHFQILNQEPELCGDGRGGTGVSAAPLPRIGITDDEFFYLTCHVDPNLKCKIGNGEFVDLEKLLVCDKFKNLHQWDREWNW